MMMMMTLNVKRTGRLVWLHCIHWLQVEVWRCRLRRQRKLEATSSGLTWMTERRRWGKEGFDWECWRCFVVYRRKPRHTACHTSTTPEVHYTTLPVTLYTLLLTFLALLTRCRFNPLTPTVAIMGTAIILCQTRPG